ncbi:transposase [Sphingomonas sp. PL-96]|nr:transposase [Sphingomonas sp. PL-96]
MRGFGHWWWHLDEMYVKLNREMVYLWRAVDHKGELLESYVTNTRDKRAALTFMKKAVRIKLTAPPLRLIVCISGFSRVAKPRSSAVFHAHVVRDGDGAAQDSRPVWRVAVPAQGRLPPPRHREAAPCGGPPLAPRVMLAGTASIGTAAARSADPAPRGRSAPGCGSRCSGCPD